MLGIDNLETESEHKLVVRITSSCWHDKSGAYCKRSLVYLKRKSVGHNMLSEDLDNIGTNEIVASIINFNTCEDGIYELTPVNISFDFETGMIDDWDYKLIDFIE